MKKVCSVSRRRKSGERDGLLRGFARTLVEELEAVEVKISAVGNEQYAAWQERTHDDVVFAVALAYWSASRAFPEDYRGTARWWTLEDGLGTGSLV
jgi:hypothetical protein